MFTMERTMTILLIGLALTAMMLMSPVRGDAMSDVVEGDNVTLECRFPPYLISREPTYYWSRTNRNEKDNVAIGDQPLGPNYSIDYRPNEGRYDLRIRNATYDRDNGQFECRLKETGSGEDLYKKVVQLTVLLPPEAPRILPSEPTATEGRSVDLTCSSSGGSPDPLIRWYRNGMNYPLDSIVKNGGSRSNPTSAILSVTPQRDDDGTEYRCVVWNRALGEGEKLETSVTLNVNYFPRVKVGPENPLRVEKGTPARLTCNVDSKPAVSSVRWTRNGRFSETSFTYTIPRVSLQDAGTYVCTADNGLGQSGEADLTLDVLYAPIVSVIPKKEVEEGESVWVKCNVTSNPRPSAIEWVKKGDPSFRQSGDILRIDRVTAAHGGTYICKAVNVLNPSGDVGQYERTGNASVALLIKHAPGKAVIEPSQPSVVEGSGVTLTCGANPSGWPLPHFRWWREGTYSTISIGAQLNIPSAKPNTEGVYFCQPSNEVGNGTVASVHLRVYQAPRLISKLPAQVNKRAGDSNFSISCTAHGKPRPSVSWVKDGTLIDPNSNNAFYRISTQDLDVKNGAHTVQSTLYFAGEAREVIMAEDRGYYACVFENEVKKEESHMYLRVQHKPIFQHKTEVKRVAYDIGDTALIPCKVQAFPKPEFEWSFKGITITIDSKSYETNLTILSNDVYVSSLIVQGVQSTDYGDYRCRATNSMGNSSAIIVLEGRGKPSAPTKVEVVETGITSALLRWEPGFDGGYEDTKFFVAYISPSEKVSGEFDCQGFNPCNVTGLSQQTLYYFRVRAYNERGESEFSQNSTARTRVDLSKIPDPVDVKYEPKSGTLVFNVLGPLPLEAKVEVQNSGEGSWRRYRMIRVDTDKFRHSIEEPTAIDNVRVSICVHDESSCGKNINANIVSDVPSVAPVGMRVHYVIGGVVTGIVLLLCLGLILIFCCCRKKKVVKKEYETNRGQTQVVPPPYYTNGMENKGMERTMDVIEDTMKNFNGQNGYISYNGHLQPNGNGTIPYIDQNSYSNSNNGGSVDSQDSLWKAPVPVEQANHPHQQQQQMSRANYEHQQYVDEYVQYNDNRNNYVTDPYGPIPKPKRRLDLIGDSPYHELSGLPDPYLEPVGEEISSNPNRTQQATMTFEESLESGYSTPNSRTRRVIREIIV